MISRGRPAVTRLVRRIKKHFAAAHLLLPFAAVCLASETTFLLNRTFPSFPLLTLIFFSTLFVYNHHRLFSLLPPARKALLLFTLENTREIMTAAYITLFSGISALTALFFLQAGILPALLPAGIICVAYSIPFFPAGTHAAALRELPLIKIFIVSSVWGYATVILPVINSGIAVPYGDVVMVLCRRMLFVFAICIPFDIRDCAADSKKGMKTIPLLVGEKRARILAVSALALFFLLGMLQYGWYEKNLYRLMFATSISAALTVFLIMNVPVRRSRYYLFLVDGTMILQFMLVLLFSFL